MSNPAAAPGTAATGRTPTAYPDVPPVPGHPEALPPRHHGPLSGEPGRAGHRGQAARHPLPGGRLGIPTLGARGLGWQVWLDGLEITQFTYFQQVGGVDLKPISGELTYGLERIAAFLQDVDSVYSLHWNNTTSYREVRLAEELQFSVYQFEMADVEMLWKQIELNERECRRLLDAYRGLKDEAAQLRFPFCRPMNWC